VVGYNPGVCPQETFARMRAEIQQFADEIKQSLELLRRYL
jgi:hypothetical protein